MPAKYKVLQRSYINKQIVEVGEEVEYDGKPGNALSLIQTQEKQQKETDKAVDKKAPKTK